MRIFLAGASGVIGRRLTQLLIGTGHDVTGATRSAQRAAELTAAGATGVAVDVFDEAALREVVVAARPDAIIHQLTDLPDLADPAAIEASLERNARLREVGTRNLVAAARAVGVERMVAQSLGFVYAAGPEPHTEADPLEDSTTAHGVRALEDLVLGLTEGIVLRYGRLYGPGTWSATPPERMPLHVDAAAQAALLALERGRRGVYNIAEDDGAATIDRAREDLGFDPAFRI